MRRQVNLEENMVCVSCLTYNHEKYIKDTLEGFLNQKTNFKFRVIIHDDVSTDGTRTILKEYERKWPELFYVIYADKNQYSKGVHITQDIVLPLAREKYLAICEGDDYWSDSNKLQLQVDYMENHRGCAMCVHDSIKIDAEGNSLGLRVNGLDKDVDYNTSDVILAGGGGLFQTSSFLCRTDIVRHQPKEFNVEGIGDYPIAVNLAMNGYVHYIGRVMSCYRVGQVGSWSVNVQKDFKARILLLHHMYNAIIKMDKYTQYKYTAAFTLLKGQYIFNLYRYEYGLTNMLWHPNDLKTALRWAVYYVEKKFCDKKKDIIENG